VGYLYSLYCLEKPSEKPRTHQRGSPTGQPYGAPKRYLSAHLTLRLPAKFALGALLEPLFGQFLEDAFSETQFGAFFCDYNSHLDGRWVRR
jgi:hypothetical protein